MCNKLIIRQCLQKTFVTCNIPNIWRLAQAKALELKRQPPPYAAALPENSLVMLQDGGRSRKRTKSRRDTSVLESECFRSCLLYTSDAADE